MPLPNNPNSIILVDSGALSELETETKRRRGGKERERERGKKKKERRKWRRRKAATGRNLVDESGEKPPWHGKG